MELLFDIIYCVLMLHWIVWNRTVFWHFILFFVLMLHWIVWNGTVFWHFILCTYATLNCLKWNCFLIFYTVYLCYTELFKMELFFDILYCVLMLHWIVWNGTVFWLFFDILYCVLMLHWIVWNGTVFWHFILCTYATLNCLKWNCFLTFYTVYLCYTEMFEMELFFDILYCVLMLHWIVWNGTVFWHFILCTYATLNCLKWNCFLTFYTVYLCYTELFEMELFFDILYCVLMLHWIVWNGTVFWYFILCTYATLNCLKWNCFLTEFYTVYLLLLHWIVWNGTVFWYFILCTYATLNCLKWNCFLTFYTVYLCYTELFKMELFICIKMDFALITYNGWYAIKPNQTPNQTSN